MSNTDDFNFEEEEITPIRARKKAADTPYTSTESEFDIPPLEPKDDPANYDEPEGSFLAEVIRTPDRITVEGFRRKCKYWNDMFEKLEPYNEKTLREEIARWDLDIPGDNEWDIDILAAAYSRSQAYMVRVTHIIGIVSTHLHAYEYANKELKIVAQGLAERGAKNPDKAAHAAYMTEPLSRRLAKVVPFHSWLVMLKDTIKHGGDQMSRINKERETDMRSNQGLMSKGNESRYNTPRPTIKSRSIFAPPPPDPIELED